MRHSKFRIQNAEFRKVNACDSALRAPRSALSRRRAFTLTELLIVMLIISIMTGLVLSALSGATELAREQRTRAIISKLDQLIMERYESYRTRAVPINTTMRQAAYGNPRTAAGNRLNGLRELMRLELPDRISDLCNTVELSDLSDGNLNAINSPIANTVSLTSMPSVARSYKRQAARSMSPTKGWSTENQSSECLYLIVSTMHDGDKNALDFFLPGEIGDTDEDGMKEILDGWGRPIQFLRWPAAYAEQPGPDGAWGKAGVDDDGNGTVDDFTEFGWPGTDDFAPPTMQTRNYVKAPDPFDPVKVDPRWGFATVAPQPYALHPLIFSAGRDKSYDVDVGGGLVYSQTAKVAANPQPAVPYNDPYYAGNPPGLLAIVGRIVDTDGDGSPQGYADNITNHYQETP